MKAWGARWLYSIVVCQRANLLRPWQTPQRNVLVRFRIAILVECRVNCHRTAANQNEAAVKQLRLGLFIPTLISLVLRFLFRRDSIPPSKGVLALYILTYFPAFFLSNYLIKIGTTRRDPQTGTLISYGEDLNQTGVTEWCFDILYITCTLPAQLTSITADPEMTSHSTRGLPSR